MGFFGQHRSSCILTVSSSGMVYKIQICCSNMAGNGSSGPTPRSEWLGPCTSTQMRGAGGNTHHPRTALERQKESRHNLLEAVTAPLEENCIFQALCVFFTIFQVKMGYLNKELRHTVTAYRTIKWF